MNALRPVAHRPLISLIVMATFAVSAQPQRPLSVVAPEEIPAPGTKAVAFTPPALNTIPDTPLGDMIRIGHDVFVDTQRYAKPYVGNKLNCVNCHLDAGRQAHSAPLWAAYVAYPAFRSKNSQINTFEQRLEGCFRFSMDGTMPPADSLVVVSLVTYAFWLASGAPVGAQLAGRGFPEVPQPALAPSATRGADVYQMHCAVCHHANGGGLKVDGKYTFPPVWGRESYNKGAGMHRMHTAAAFIKAHMPLGQGGTLTDQQAWDVAAYIDTKPRPPDPRTRSRGPK
jgi:thiosulfate dehydrogenase